MTLEIHLALLPLDCLGVQIRRVICKDEETKKGVSDDYCRGSDKPVQHSRQCNTVCATRLALVLVTVKEENVTRNLI